MTSPEHDPSIEHEPHLKATRPTPDPSEPDVKSRLNAEKSRMDVDEERARHSIYDEPAILPGRGRVVIDQDWNCRNCGYNLRGLLTGHPCPECGVVERYEPPREQEVSYAKWASTRQPPPSGIRLAGFVAGTVVFMVPLAAICSFLLIEQLQVFFFCVLGPIVAEIAKLAPALFATGRMEKFRASGWQVYLVAGVAAMVFSLIQSLINVTLIHKNAPAELVAFRWIVGPALHLLCTLIAARKLANARDLRASPGAIESLGNLGSIITVPILIHAVWNVVVFMRGYVGYGY